MNILIAELGKIYDSGDFFCPKMLIQVVQNIMQMCGLLAENNSWNTNKISPRLKHFVATFSKKLFVLKFTLILFKSNLKCFILGSTKCLIWPKANYFYFLVCWKIQNTFISFWPEMNFFSQHSVNYTKTNNYSSNSKCDNFFLASYITSDQMFWISWESEPLNLCHCHR